MLNEHSVAFVQGHPQNVDKKRVASTVQRSQLLNLSIDVVRGYVNVAQLILLA